VRVLLLAVVKITPDLVSGPVQEFWLLIFKFASGGPFAATFHARLPHVN
jgi:hypothetical protein